MAEKDIVQPNPLAPRIEQSPSRSESAREEVAGVRTRKILDGLTAALADHGYDDTRITDANSLVATIRSYRPGDTVTVTWLRGGEEQSGELVLDSDAE